MRGIEQTHGWMPTAGKLPLDFDWIRVDERNERWQMTEYERNN